MGYSGRYHAASLAAVFLALAVGILIGVGFGSDIVSGTAEDLEQSLEADLGEARQQVDELEVDLEAERAFGEAVYPAVVGDALRGDRVAIIGLGGLEGAVAAEVERALGPAGATVGEVAVVREPPDLDALASTLGGRQARAVSRGAEEELTLFAERAGSALVRGGADFDALRGTMLSRYSGQPGGIDSVVLVRQRPAELDPDQEASTDLLENGVVAGLLDAGAAPVGAEVSGADPSSIEFFDSHGLTSVDSVDLNSGRVALVFALCGASGSFGVKDTADTVLPDLVQGNACESGGGR